jgi:hypothetical protein
VLEANGLFTQSSDHAVCVDVNEEKDAFAAYLLGEDNTAFAYVSTVGLLDGKVSADAWYSCMGETNPFQEEVVPLVNSNPAISGMEM